MKDKLNNSNRPKNIHKTSKSKIIVDDPIVRDVHVRDYTPIPDVYPTDLQECMQVFENIRYKHYGYGVVFLDYNYSFKYWSVMFRNPANFDNPNIKEKTPIEAVHKMFDFLKLLISYEFR